jgi:hypothetical protein
MSIIRLAMWCLLFLLLRPYLARSAAVAERQAALLSLAYDPPANGEQRVNPALTLACNGVERLATRQLGWD